MEVDIEMMKTEVKKGLGDSKHMVKKLTKKEKAKMIEEIGILEEQNVGKDKVMKDEEKVRKSDLFTILYDRMKALQLIRSMMKNNEVVGEFKTF